MKITKNYPATAQKISFFIQTKQYFKKVNT